MPAEEARDKARVPRGDLASVAPANLAAAKEEFFAKKGSVAPRFIYTSSALSRGLAIAAFSHSDRHGHAAAHVLQRVLHKYGGWTQWEQHCNGAFLPSDEVERRVAAYLADLRCDHVISVAWDHAIVAPTMLAGRRLLLRGPYREGRVRSPQVLDHEIGTHFVRKYNGKLQPKTGPKPKYSTQTRLETEEGLASINTVLAQRHPLIVDAALNYLAASAAQRMGFVELYRYLRAYVDNQDKLWTLCVRTKRGLVDTGRAGGYCKDQVSFAGLMQLLQNRERVSFELLHSCKLPWQCVASNPNLQRAREFGHPMLVSAFIMEGEAAYRRRLDDLVQANDLDRFLGSPT